MIRFSSFGPAVAHISPYEALRAGLGAFLGLSLVGFFVLSPTVDLALGLYLVAPFGASAVLLFAVPNSPLAQPWSAVVGNTVAALVAVAVCGVISDPTLRIALAVGLAITITILCRALHPPAGAIAMTAAMSPDAVQELGFMFAITPVALGTIVLVAAAFAYGRLTGRHYPFRQFNEPNSHGTLDPDPVERFGLSEADLAVLLDNYRQSFNLGVEDLARLIGAAEMQAASLRAAPVTAADIMSRDLITVQPGASLAETKSLFIQHNFTSLPVVSDEDEFLGIIFQFHLLRYDCSDQKNAAKIMCTSIPRATPETPLTALIPIMAGGDVDAVPVIATNRLAGIVTRTDLISALARISLK
mgnify:CR=1 FL=1